MNPNFPPNLGNHLAGSVRSARRRYRKRLARCQEKFSEKSVHALRTETRRILALLDLLEAFHFKGALKKQRKIFKKRLDVFDDLRDTHVQRVLLKPLWRDFPEAHALKKHLSACERRLESEMSRKIQKTKGGKSDRTLKKIQKSVGYNSVHPPIGPSRLAQSLLDVAFRRVVVLRGKIQRNDPTTIHKMRVAFKRFRYTAELLLPLLSHFTESRLTRMKDFQARAGNIQDVAVLLERLAKDVKNGDVKPAAVKKLRGELLRRERRAIDYFMERVDELMDFEPEHSLPVATKTKPASK